VGAAHHLHQAGRPDVGRLAADEIATVAERIVCSCSLMPPWLTELGGIESMITMGHAQRMPTLCGQSVLTPSSVSACGVLQAPAVLSQWHIGTLVTHTVHQPPPTARTTPLDADVHTYWRKMAGSRAPLALLMLAVLAAAGCAVAHGSRAGPEITLRDDSAAALPVVLWHGARVVQVVSCVSAARIRTCRADPHMRLPAPATAAASRNRHGRQLLQHGQHGGGQEAPLRRAKGVCALDRHGARRGQGCVVQLLRCVWFLWGVVGSVH
jgi:hypothetical protein